MRIELVDESGIVILNISEQIEVDVHNSISDYNYGDDYFYTPRTTYALNVRIYNPTWATYQYFSDMMARLHPLRSNIRLIGDGTLMTFSGAVCVTVNQDRSELSEFISVSWQTTQINYGNDAPLTPIVNLDEIRRRRYEEEPIEEEIDWLTEGF